MYIGEGVAMGFEIKNLDSLFAKLNSMDDAAVKAVEKGMKQGIKYTQAEAKLLCPVDTGDLRNSIKSRVEIDGRAVSGIVATNNDHAAYVEFGTGQRGEASPSPPKSDLEGLHYKKDWKGQPAQPFLYPAIHATKDQVTKVVSDVAIKELLKAVGK